MNLEGKFVRFADSPNDIYQVEVDMMLVLVVRRVTPRFDPKDGRKLLPIQQEVRDAQLAIIDQNNLKLHAELMLNSISTLQSQATALQSAYMHIYDQLTGRDTQQSHAIN
jgi:hypothetical protein